MAYTHPRECVCILAPVGSSTRRVQIARFILFFSLPYTLHGDFSASMFMTRQMEGSGALIGSDMGLASASWSCKLLSSFSFAFSRVRDSAEMSVAHKTKGLNLRPVASSEAVFSAWMVHAY